MCRMTINSPSLGIVGGPGSATLCSSPASDATRNAGMAFTAGPWIAGEYPVTRRCRLGGPDPRRGAWAGARGDGDGAASAPSVST